MVGHGLWMAIILVGVIAFFIISGIVITADNLAGALIAVGFCIFLYIQFTGGA